MSLLDDLCNSGTQLEQKTSFQDVFYFVGRVEQPPVWSEVEAKYRQKVMYIPPDLQSVYEEINGLVVHWNYQGSLTGPALVVGLCDIFPFALLGRNDVYFAKAAGAYEECFWDETLPLSRQAAYAQYFIWDQLANRTYTVWREVEGQATLAFYLGGDRLHALPFSARSYLETGAALGFIELWQLLFIAEAEQTAYAEAIGTVVAQVHQLFPESLALLPAHVTARFPPPTLPAAPDYRQLVTEALRRLQALPAIELLTNDNLPPGATLGVCERLRRELGHAVPPELLGFYQQLNGCHLRWRWIHGPGAAAQQGGTLHFWPLERVFGGDHSSSRKHWDDSLHDDILWEAGYFEDMPQVRQLRPFEEPAGAELTCLKLPSTTGGKIEIYLLTGLDSDKLIHLPTSLPHFIVTAFTCLGIDNWQYLLTQETYDVTAETQAGIQRLGVDLTSLSNA